MCNTVTLLRNKNSTQTLDYLFDSNISLASAKISRWVWKCLFTKFSDCQTKLSGSEVSKIKQREGIRRADISCYLQCTKIFSILVCLLRVFFRMSRQFSLSYFVQIFRLFKDMQLHLIPRNFSMLITFISRLTNNVKALPCVLQGSYKFSFTIFAVTSE